MDSKLEEVLKTLPLTNEIVDALLAHSGPYGEALSCTLAYEHADWDRVKYNGLPRETISELYIQSIEWSEVAIHQLGDRR